MILFTLRLPAGEPRTGRRERGEGDRYIGGQAQVQCGPPLRRPAMYTTHGGTSTCACLPDSTLLLLLLSGPGSHPPLPSTRGAPFKPQSGDNGCGAIGEPGRSHNLESLCCRIVFFWCGVCACMPYLACPASLCHQHAMPCQWGSGRILFSGTDAVRHNHRPSGGVSVSWPRPSQYR